MSKTWSYYNTLAIVQFSLLVIGYVPVNAEDDAPQTVIDRLKPTRPQCSIVEFDTIAVGWYAGLQQIHTEAKQSRTDEEFQRFISMNPLECSPSAMTQTYFCRGLASLKGKGVITSWGKEYYEIVTPVDFENGTNLTMLYIDRYGAKCLDHIKPSYGRYNNILAAKKKMDW